MRTLNWWSFVYSPSPRRRGILTTLMERLSATTVAAKTIYTHRVYDWGQRGNTLTYMTAFGMCVVDIYLLQILQPLCSAQGRSR